MRSIGQGGSMDRCTGMIALLFSIAGVVLLVVALTGEEWLVLETSTHTEYFGLLKYCPWKDNCEYTRLEDIENPAWLASIALWVISLILIGIGSLFVLFGVVGVETYKAFGIGSKIVYVGFIFQTVGLIVWPASFEVFGERCANNQEGDFCTTLNNNNAGCSGDTEFKHFTICSPYDLGYSFILACVGIGLQMIATVIYSCVDYDL